MTWATRSGAAKLRSTHWWIVAAVLLAAGTGCLVVGVPGHEHPLAGPVTSLHRDVTATRSSRVEPVVARSVPVALHIPAIGLTTSLSTLGLNTDGTVQVPTDYQQPGWFRLGPTPGQVGSAVILGHVDNHQGPAVFFQIRSLVPGDPVNVTLADGVTARIRGDLGGDVLEIGVPRPAGLRIARVQHAAVGHLRGNLRHSNRQLSVEHRCLHVACLHDARDGRSMRPGHD